MNTMRERLHAAANQAEQACTNLRSAEATYDAARGVLNGLIDKVCPLGPPNGVVAIEQVRAVLTDHKIALIKLVREATHRHDYNNDGNMMGLADAKALVESWIEGQL
jgi:ribosomal protein L7/L12